VIICTVEDGSDAKERASAKAAVKATINLLFLYQSAVSKQMPCPAPPNPTAMPHIMGQRDVKEAEGGVMSIQLSLARKDHHIILVVVSSADQNE
jgi:hypothetical protein